MATYAELLSAFENETLKKRIRVACWVAADIVRAESNATTNHANRMLWAREVFRNPDVVAEQMITAVLAQNRAVALATILAADDAAVQTAVNNAVDLLAGV